MQNSGGGYIAQAVKGVFLSVICSLIGILLFAVVLKIATLPHTAVKAVNQFIKCVSLFVGCTFSLKGSLGVVKGLTVGLFYALALFLIFTVLDGGYFGKLVLEIIFCAVIGGISGIVAVNLRAK